MATSLTTHLGVAGVCGLLMGGVLLPLSLAILLIQNWVFGSLLCYVTPMMQVRVDARRGAVWMGVGGGILGWVWMGLGGRGWAWACEGVFGSLLCYITPMMQVCVDGRGYPGVGVGGREKAP